MGLCAMKLVDFLNKACCGARETILIIFCSFPLEDDSVQQASCEMRPFNGVEGNMLADAKNLCTAVM